MRALRKLQPARGLSLVTLPVPQPGPTDVLVRIRAAGVCGTDYHIYAWDAWSQRRTKPPFTVGHEFVGEIAAVGAAIRHVAIGQRVSGEGHIVCGRCYFCRTGQGHICETVKIIGVDRDGCFAEYMVFPAENLWPVPESIPDRYAAIFDPLGNAMHTVMAAKIAGASVLVMGAGAIGIFAVGIAKAVGAATVLVVEPNDFKRRLARNAGADIVLDPRRDDVIAAARKATGGLGPEVVLEMSGNAKGMQQAFQVLRKGGEISLLGIPPADVCVDWAEDIIFKGITIHAINGRRMYDTWYQTHDFLLHHQARIKPVITHILPFTEFQQAFDAMEQGTCGKAVLTFDRFDQ
jgi:threonine 3-dehydrogenase